MLILYNNAYSTCSQKVRICLHEKQLAWTDQQINFRKQEHLTSEYLAINPNGVVPTLVHDGKPIVDSSVIMEYLDEEFPSVSLSPETSFGRAEMRAWMRFFEEVPTVAVRFPSFNQAFLRHFGKLEESEFSKVAAARPLRKHFFQQMGQSGFSEKDIRNSLERFRTTVTRMERSLGDGRSWLLGPSFSIADACVAPLYDRMNDLGLGWLWDGKPSVSGWFQRIQNRPSYAATFYPGTRLSSLYADLRDGAPPREWFENDR